MAGLISISARGLKSSDRSVRLRGRNLVLGAVGSGKSSVLDAIRICALSYVPAIGKSPAATARLMRDNEIDVGIELSDGRRVERSLARDGQRLTGSAHASWLPPRTKDTEAGEAIRALFGASDAEAAQHLDIRQLLACTPNERAKQIEALLDASGMDVTTAALRGRALTTLRAAGIDPDRMPLDLADATSAAAGAEALLDRALRIAVAGIRDTLDSQLRTSGIAAAADAMRAAKNDSAAACREQIAARSQLELRLVALQAPADSLESLRARRDAARDAIARARRDLEAADAAARARAEVEAVLPVLRDQVTRAEGEHEIALEALETARDCRSETAGIGDDPAPPEAPVIVEPDPDVIAMAERWEAQAAEDDAAADRIVIPAAPPTAAEERAVTVARQRLERSNADPWGRILTIADEIAAAADGDDDEETPLMRWSRSLREVATEQGARSRDELKAELAVAERALGALQEQVQDHEQRRECLAKDLADIRAMAAGYRTDATKARREATVAARTENARRAAEHERLMAAWRAQVDALRQRRAGLLRRAEQIEAGARQAQEDLDRARADLTAAEARLTGQADVAVDAVAARSLLTDAEAAIAEIGPKIVVVEGADACRREMAALLEQIERATALQAAYAAAEWACQRLREEDLRARAGGLEERMRVFLRGAGRSEDPYLRASKGICDFGLRRDGHEISVEALSGGESVLFMAALAAAVIALRAPECRVLLIEAAELGAGETADAVLRGCEAITDAIETVIVATCAAIEPRTGWNVIHTGELVEVAR